jgi:hypothetical protein
LRIKDGRTQVGEQVEFAANLQQATFRANGALNGVPLRAADGTKQNGIGFAGGIQCNIWQRYAMGVDGAATQQLMLPGKSQIELVVDRRENLSRLLP